MKNRHILKRIIAIALALVTLLSIALPTDTTYAASSYTDPYIFYHSCNTTNGQKIEFTNQGYFYYGTRSLAASSSKNDRFRTIGWAITLSAGGQSVDIYCANGQTIEYLSSPAGYTAGDGYNYMLYRASYNKLAALAYARNPAAAEVVFSQSEDVSMAALITVVQGGTGQLLGAVSEYGNGLIAQSGTVWNAYSDVNTILSKFATFNYADYVLHYPAAITNYKLSVFYKSEDVNKNTSTHAVSLNGYTIDSNEYLKSGNTVRQNASQLGTIVAKHPVDYFGLSKVGYYIEAGSEWVIEDTFVQVAAGYPYYTSQLNYRVNYQDCSTTLVANWEPCIYTFVEDKAGGTGGTDVFYQKYDTGFYSEEGCTNLITSISIPGRIGYNFCGRIEKVDKRRVLDEKDGDRI